MYFNVNFNVFLKLIKVHLLVSELYIHQRHVSAMEAILITNTKSWNCNIYFLYNFVCILKMDFLAETCC